MTPSARVRVFAHPLGEQREHCSTASSACAHLFLAACMCVRLGRFDEVEVILNRVPRATLEQAPCLNLTGVLALADGNWNEAVRCWKRAVHIDRNYLPARRNLRRYFELFQFGRSDVPIALGDEPERLTHVWDEP